jgi:subtilisin family serine protease
MYTYTFGGKNGKKHLLHESTDMLVVRMKKSGGNQSLTYKNLPSDRLARFDLEEEFPEAGIVVYKVRPGIRNRALTRDNARTLLKKDSSVRFAGKVLVEEDGRTIVLYTENIFIKFRDDMDPKACEKILKRYKLSVKQKPGFADNSYFVGTPENTGVDVFNIAEKLLELKEVELCHPELIRKKSLRKIHPLQWHLMPTVVNGHKITAGVSADEAHKISTGKNIVIAIIDDGFDIDHVEFNMKRKIVHPKDMTSGTSDPRPRFPYENHGTSCAGVAAASGVNASGVAPDAILMPVRLSSNLGSMAEANAFKYASDNGADIISCSWGPADGDWSNPHDPAHTTYTDIPDSTRLAIDYCVARGRGGKGCIVAFAAGNGNEDIKYDGYSSYAGVIAVAACNDTGRRSVYSDFGRNVWCSFPSSDLGYPPFKHPEPLTNGIYTTDRSGAKGYNPSGDYTDDFGGTSSSCPGLAGTVALMLSANPGLTWKKVREIIRLTCDRINEKGGNYDSHGHSKYYGYGRVNTLAAVTKALNVKTSILRESRGRNNNPVSSAISPTAILSTGKRRKVTAK